VVELRVEASPFRYRRCTRRFDPRAYILRIGGRFSAA
jgi:hypothetical protein